MAFKVFRKHQKTMLVVLTLMAIAAFVFLDPLMGVIGGGGGKDNPPVVKTNYGTLYEYDIQRLIQTQHVLNEFLERAWQLAFSAGGRPTVYPMIRMDSQRNVTEEMVVRRLMMTRRAEELGFRVNDKVVNRYLQQLTGGAVQSDQLRAIIKGVQIAGRDATMNMILDALRDEMLAREFEETYNVSAAVTPAQSWEYFLRLNDRVTVELLPVDVSDFVSKVAAPTDAQLQEFYAAHKEEYKLPDIAFGVELESPRAGFRQPEQAAFAYVKADFDAIVDRLASEISDEEVAKYYEENKRQFIRPQLLGEEEPESTESKDAAPEDEAEPTTDSAPADKAAEPEKPAEEAKPADDAQKPAEAAQPKDESQPADDKQSAILQLTPAQFVAYADEEAAPKKPADENPADEKPADEKPADEKPAEVKPEAEGEAPQAEPAAGETPAKEAAQEESPPAEAKPEAAPPKEEFYPLAEVEADIRRDIARQKAAEQVQSSLAPILAAMDEYSRQVIAFELSKGDGADQKAAERPAPPDLKKMAADAGLEFEQTPLMSYFQLRETPLGQSMVASVGQQFSMYTFAGKIKVFRAVQTLGADGSGYAVWKTEMKAEGVPTLDEVRPEVVQAWKMQEARKLARAEAEKLATEARGRNETLAQAFPDKQVVTTEPFSWLTFGAVPQMQRTPSAKLSEIPGVPNIGPSFMQEVFKLADGEISVAANHPETVVYVVRMSGHTATEDALHQRFLGEPGPWQQLAMMQNGQQIVMAINANLAKEVDLEWLRAPNSAGGN